MGNIYKKKPIIVLGANHSGTRLIVEMLSVFGSDGGECDNHWREERCFLSLHQQLMKEVNSQEWSDAIFDIDFIESFQDNGSYAEMMETYLSDCLVGHYADRENHPWHWKCPTSALFLQSWLRVYPEAHFVHVVRDSCDVAASLMRRRQIYNPCSGVRFDTVMNKKIEAVRGEMKHYIKVPFNNIEEELENLADFMPFEVSEEKKRRARACIKKRQWRWWMSGKSIRRNIWEYIVFVSTALCKILCTKYEKK